MPGGVGGVIVIDGGAGIRTVTEGGGGGASTMTVGRGAGASTTTTSGRGWGATTTRGLSRAGDVVGPTPTVVVSGGAGASSPHAVRVSTEKSENIVSKRPTERMGTSTMGNVDGYEADQWWW
jgi:hypothetical protein